MYNCERMALQLGGTLSAEVCVNPNPGTTAKGMLQHAWLYTGTAYFKDRWLLVSKLPVSFFPFSILYSVQIKNVLRALGWFSHLFQ